MTDWQTMETAPKDGSVVFGFGSVDGDVRRCLMQWGDGWGAGSATKPNGPCWGVSDGARTIDDQGWDTGTGCYLQVEPTHWMPLPEPPT